MAITRLDEASAVNTVASWILGKPQAGRGIPSDQQARDALVLLADSAHSKLSAGLWGKEVECLWPEHPGFGEHQPARGDHIETWLKRKRDDARDQDGGAWGILDDLLDAYRLHADTGVPLDQPTPSDGADK